MFALVLTLLAEGSPAAALTFDPNVPSHRRHVRSYSTNDGLPQSSILGIARSGDGYLWLATLDGLARFDGVRFVVFDRNSVPPLDDGHLSKLFGDARGRVWVGSQNGAVTTYAESRLSLVTKLDDTIQAFTEDSTGQVWAAAGTSVVAIGASARFSFPARVTALAAAPGGLWVGTTTGLFRVTNGQVSEGPRTTAVTALLADGDGLLVGTERSLLRTAASGDDVRTLLDAFVLALHRDALGRRWVSFTGGIGVVEAERVTTVLPSSSLGEQAYNAIFSDDEGSLWLGGQYTGLTQLWEQKLSVFTTEHGLPSNLTNVVLTDRGGQLWVGTAEGLARRSGERFERETSPLGKRNINALGVTRQGELLAAVLADGVVRRDGSRAAASLPSSTVWAMLEDRAGLSWVGTNKGVAVFARDGAKRPLPVGLSGDRVTSLFEAADGAIFAASMAGGLDRFDGARFRPVVQKTTVYAITAVDNGDLWLSTMGQGLMRLRGGDAKALTTRDGLFSDTIYAAQLDAAGDFWLTGNRGLFRVSRADMDAVLDGRRTRVDGTLFGTTDGLLASEFNGAAHFGSAATTDGKLWFPSIAGLVMVDPSHLARNTVPPPVVIERVLADGVEVRDSDELPIDHERLELQFSALSFRAPQRVRFRYKLDGFDKDWIEVVGRRSAEYTNLPPGAFHFRVMAANDDGVWNEAGASRALRLAPHFYETSGFFAACALLVIVGVWLGLRLRVRALNRRAEELEQLVQQRTALVRQQRDELEASYKQADRIFDALKQALTGRLLDDRFRLEDELGQGGFGVVFKATEVRSGHVVAVKVFRPTPGNDSVEALERFKMEGKAGTRFRHPHAIEVHEYGVTTDGVAFMVMELLRGGSLKAELAARGGRLDPRRCLAIMLPVLEALSAAHAVGIVHRDVKPDNIYLHERGSDEIVKLLDFGVAKLQQDALGVTKQTLTFTGAVIGTPFYMAPERLDGIGTYDGRSDVYSVGVIFYEALSGRPLFAAGDTDSALSPLNMIMNHLHTPPTPLGEIAPQLPGALVAVVMAMLEKNPSARPSADDVLAKLRLVRLE